MRNLMNFVNLLVIPAICFAWVHDARGQNGLIGGIQAPVAATSPAAEPATTSAPATGPAVDASPAKISELIKQLGDDNFKLRESASKELARIGIPAKGELEKAAKSDDMEVKQRSSLLLDEIAKLEAQALSDSIARKLAWSTPIKTGAMGSPVVCGNAVYVTAEDGLHVYDAATGKETWGYPCPAGTPFKAGTGLVAVSENDKLMVLDAKNGKAKWQVTLTNPGQAAMDDSRVYVVDAAGKLSALSAAEGKEEWKADTNMPSATVVLAGKTLLVSGGGEAAVAGPGGFGGGGPMAGPAPAMAVKRIRPVGAGTGSIKAFDTTGKSLWEQKDAMPVLAMATDDKAVYVLHQSDVTALGLADGKQLWKTDLPEPVGIGMWRVDANGRRTMSSMEPNLVLAGDNVYLSTAQRILGLATKDGQKAVDQKLELAAGDANGNFNGRMVVNGNVAVANMVARIGPGVMGGGAGLVGVVDNLAYYQQASSLQCFDIKAGKMLWNVTTSNPLSGRPVLQDGVLYLGVTSAANAGNVRIAIAPANTDNGPAAKEEPAKELKVEPGIHALKLK